MDTTTKYKECCFVALIVCLLSLTSCKKYLDVKPVQNLAVPSTIIDLQKLLDNDSYNGSSPAAYSEFVADNYYITTTTWNSIVAETNLTGYYTWNGNAKLPTPYVWNLPYNSIYQANFVLDELKKISLDASERGAFNNVKGSALFYRSFMFHQLAQLFCRPYSSSASTDLGIILRLDPDVLEKVNRATVQQTYNQIISDLKTAAVLLPLSQSYVSRPSKAAAFGELARVYLSMRDYVNAAHYADSCLSLQSSLMDYNSLALPPSLGRSAFPIYSSNPEVIYESYGAAPPFPTFMAYTEQVVDTLLYQSYSVNDLRRAAFFQLNAANGTNYWWGSYENYLNNNYNIYDGLATDEIYLIRAECEARAGDVAGAMSDLNSLLRKRWKTGTFNELGATDANDALSKVLIERRKELAFRGLRWSDLRRLNLEGVNITLKRNVNGIIYTLPSNDLRWVLLIPDDEITRSGISQNPR